MIAPTIHTDDDLFDWAQEAHEQRQRDDPEHDRGGCVCCCNDCDDLVFGPDVG